ncbi:MAG: ribonuclease P protein component [bacterium]
MRHFLPKTEILRKRVDFGEIFRQGRRWEGKYFKLFCRASERRMVGFAVGKKLGIAVVRNRMKRLMREIYRKHRRSIGKYQIMMCAKVESVNKDIAILEKEFVRFMRILES